MNNNFLNLMRSNNHSSTLFHYTPNLGSVLDILKDGFKYGYCIENFFDQLFACIPMISFCDIPISQSYEHSSKYGNFAIGLSKKSLLENHRNEIAPVNYCLTIDAIKASMIIFNHAQKYESYLNNLLNDDKSYTVIDERGNSHQERELNIKEGNRTLMALFGNEYLSEVAYRSLGLMKMYESVYKGEMQINYDECEWRLVYPEHKMINDGQYCKWFWGETESECRQWKENRKFLNAQNLSFSVDDINYIIVPSYNEIPTIIHSLTTIDTICGKKISNEDRALLLSKVICFEQISTDL